MQADYEIEFSMSSWYANKNIKYFITKAQKSINPKYDLHTKVNFASTCLKEQIVPLSQ